MPSVANAGHRRAIALLTPIASLTGCHSSLLDPSGYVALQQRDLLLRSSELMLLIIVPVIALTVLFAWRYRHTNTHARYEPEWHHSTRLELVIWSAPLLIIICLGALTWVGTHLLDPYRPLDRLGSSTKRTAENRPLEIQVIALDWKWLFIYPEYGIAVVNELAAPVNRPIALRITSASVMNSLYIPDLAGQIYAMAGMETRLHGVLNQPTVSQGFSSNYSGAGFSGMHFTLRGLTAEDFERWVRHARDDSGKLSRARYLELEKPSEKEAVQFFSQVDATLFHDILNRCIAVNSVCMDRMMTHE